MIIDNKFDIGETVYVKTDIEQRPRMITAIKVSANGIIYETYQGLQEGTHYDFELSREKDIVLATE